MDNKVEETRKETIYEVIRKIKEIEKRQEQSSSDNGYFEPIVGEMLLSPLYSKLFVLERDYSKSKLSAVVIEYVNKGKLLFEKEYHNNFPCSNL